MEKKKIYEYVVIKDWVASLEKGCRLYYDINEQSYIFHTEHEDSYGSDFYMTRTFRSNDVMLSIDSINHLIEDGHLIPGPELGELELKDIENEEFLEEGSEEKTL